MKTFEAFAILVERRIELKRELAHQKNNKVTSDKLTKLLQNCELWMAAVELIEKRRKQIKLVKTPEVTYNPAWSPRPAELPLA